MPLPPPPIQSPILSLSRLLSQPWIKWLTTLTQNINAGWSGQFTNGDGKTVTVTHGKITDVS